VRLWKRIKQLSALQLFRLATAMIQKPLLIWPTWKATVQTIKICDDLYGNAHHKNGKPNAFRHVLWNILICKKTMKIIKNDEKSIIWAEKITCLYEKVTKNDILDQRMDLHNNELGRKLFLIVLDQKIEEIITFIQIKVKNAQKMTKKEQIEDYKDTLVYISE